MISFSAAFLAIGNLNIHAGETLVGLFWIAIGIAWLVLSIYKKWRA